MSFRFKQFGGLVRYDHRHKIIFLQRHLDSEKSEHRFINKLGEFYPEYKVVSKK